MQKGKLNSGASFALLLVAALSALAYFYFGGDESDREFLEDLAEVVAENSTGGVLTPTPLPPEDQGEGQEEGTDQSDSGQSDAEPPAADLPTAQPQADFYRIYFTDPTCPPEEERHGGVDETIAADLLLAQEQVDIAAFDLDAEPIVNALIELENRGVIVRVVTDTDNADLSSIRRLRRHGTSVVEDKRTGLMHNKFVVIDGRFVWMGSLNFTTNGIYCNNNNMVRFDAPGLAANYSAEMNEMYDERRFGPDSPDSTPQERLTIQNVAISNYFSPERELELINVIARTVARAEEEILFLAFSFTNEEIGEAMLGRADAGVPIRGIFENVGSNSASSYYPIMSVSPLANVEVQRDANPYIMHHKVIIVDRQFVVFGSFNFSASANRKNDENILIVHDATFANHFVNEFERLWEQAMTHAAEAE